MIEQIAQSLQTIVLAIQMNLKTLGIILLTLWAFFFLSQIFPQLLFLGIIPRRLRGLRGIVFAPLLHANFNHLFFNSIPLLVLASFILIHGLQQFIEVSLAISLFSGLGIWCFAKPGIHLGASALITGYWGYLVTNIYQQSSPINLILGVISLYYFAGIFLGIFPGKKGVSWEGHLFGLLAGIATALWLNAIF